MTYLILLLVVALVYAHWRSQRRPLPPDAATRRAPPAGTGAVQEMVRCPACGLHVPSADAVAGRQGRLYCSPAHRDAADRS